MFGEEGSGRIPLGFAIGGTGKASTKGFRVVALIVFGCVPMLWDIAEREPDRRSSRLPAKREDCATKVRREVIPSPYRETRKKQNGEWMRGGYRRIHCRHFKRRSSRADSGL